MTDRYLRTGIFLAPFHALDENPTLAIERDMELVQHLDRLNYHEAWIGEHHSGGFEIIASPEMFIAAAAERTRHIRLGTGVVSLPYHNPFMLASRMTQLDHMTRGRAMFGVGPGALVHDAAKIGIKAADQRSRMNELLDVIVELMAGKSVTRKTDWFDLTAAQLQLPSYSQPGMEMAVACARSPVGAVASGRHGIGMLSIGGTSDDALKAHAANWKIYTDHAQQNGKVGRPLEVAHRHLRPRGADARAGLRRREVRPRSLHPVFHRRRDLPDPAAGHHRRRRFLTKEGIACIGTPDDCIRHFERLWKGSDGGFGAVLLLANNWADWTATQRSYELMARYVHPHFQRGANAPRQLSYDTAVANRGTFSVQSQAAVATEIEKYQAAQSKRAAE